MSGLFFFIFADAAILDQRRFFFLNVNLKAVPSVVDNHNPPLRVDSNSARMCQPLFIIGIISKCQVPLANHIRVGRKLVPTPLG